MILCFHMLSSTCRQLPPGVHQHYLPISLMLCLLHSCYQRQLLLSYAKHPIFVSVCFYLRVFWFFFEEGYEWEPTSVCILHYSISPSLPRDASSHCHPTTSTFVLLLTGSNFIDHEFSQYCRLDWSSKELQPVCVAQVATASGGKGKQLHKLQHICFARPPCSRYSRTSFRTPCSNRNRDDILRVKWADFLGNRWC